MSNHIAPDVVYKLRGVGDPSLSPDGTRLAYTKSWVEEQSLESRSRIMMMDLATGQAQEFTQGTKDGAPKFSPSGGLLGFLRSNDQGRRQLWLMAADGGEARRLTTDPGAVADFAWSPSGDRIVYSADVNPDPPKEPEKESIPRVTVVKRIRYRYDTLGWRGDSHFHLFITGTNGSGVQPLTSGDWDDLAPAWSPDGSQIAFISGRRDDRDLQALTELYVVPAEGGDPVLWSEGLSGVGAIAWSPDGQRLVVAASEEPGGLVVWQSWLYILEPGKPPKQLTDDSVKPNVGFPPINPAPELRWTNDGRILFLGERRGETFLYQVPDIGGEASPLTDGGGQISALALDAQATKGVVLSSSPSSPGDLHRIDLTSHNNSSQLTDLNQDFLSQNPPASMEKFSFERGGLDIECRLWRPPEFDPAQHYPLVLDVHGGPNGAFYDSFAPVQQVLATAGYLVLAVNPRGSSTYGNDFMKAVLGDWGGEDYLDLMAAVDLVADRPYVDSTRLGVHGYSYGGFMASWIIGHTGRFKAAVVGAPCIDLFSMYGTSDIGVSFGEVQWGGSLADAAPELIKHSPISYAGNVTAPVLLLHGEADARCPIGQSEEYFVVLKRLGKEVEFVRFPGCSHLFTRLGHPKMREEYLSRTLGWFEKHL